MQPATQYARRGEVQEVVFALFEFAASCANSCASSGSSEYKFSTQPELDFHAWWYTCTAFLMSRVCEEVLQYIKSLGYTYIHKVLLLFSWCVTDRWSSPGVEQILLKVALPGKSKRTHGQKEVLRKSYHVPTVRMNLSLLPPYIFRFHIPTMAKSCFFERIRYRFL